MKTNLTLDKYWMPFTPNRLFQTEARLIVSAQGMYYQTADGRQILDGTAGLWCCNAGHARPRIVAAICEQAQVLDYGPAFNMGNPLQFELSQRLIDLAPDGFSKVFYCNSGSEAVDNRRLYGHLLAGVDHLRHTHDPARNSFSQGMPEHGAELADDLLSLIGLHDASTIAAVIVEPVACSTGVLVPPVGYLERLRKICADHGILLIFDEVITGFGRIGAPFASTRFNVTPDIITMAKGLTNGAVPMGGVMVREGIFEAMAAATAKTGVEFPHGYTYSGHPLACAAALATLDTYEDDGLFARSRSIEGYFENRLHSLRAAPHVLDIRNFGMIGAIELKPRPDAPGARGHDLYLKCFEAGVLIRATGDTVAMSPPLIISEQEIDMLFSVLAEQLAQMA